MSILQKTVQFLRRQILNFLAQMGCVLLPRDRLLEATLSRPAKETLLDVEQVRRGPHKPYIGAIL